MRKEQFLLTFISSIQEGQKELYTNNTEKRLLDITNETSIKIWTALNNHDILFILKKEQKIFIPIISWLYWIDFNIEVQPIWNIISQTSLKCLLIDINWNKYFLKQKPFYSIENQELAYDFQNYLSKNTKIITNILKTLDWNNYFQILDNYYFLTKFIEWEYYSWKLEQSVSSSIALTEIHNRSIYFNTNWNIKWIKDDLKSLLNLLLQKNTSNELLQNLIYNIELIINKYQYDNYYDEYLVLHRDFAPYNIVFDKNNNVICVNDFDNCCFWSSLIDLAEMIVTHTVINYAWTTSHMREPISNFFDIKRAEKMIYSYLHNRNNYDENCLKKLPNNVVLIWIELMLVWLLRWDFSIKAISDNLNYTDLLFNQSKSIV